MHKKAAAYFLLLWQGQAFAACVMLSCDFSGPAFSSEQRLHEQITKITFGLHVGS